MNFEQIIQEVKFTAIRASGPGGQNVNKVSSQAQLHWEFQNSHGLKAEEKKLVATKLAHLINRENTLGIKSQEYRSLEQNKQHCLDKLKKILDQALYVPSERIPTKPSYNVRKKRRKEKFRRSEIKKLRQRKYDD